MTATATTSESKHASGAGWGWLLTGGILIMLAGIFMLVFPVVSSLSVTLIAGWTMVFAGVAGFVSAITNRAEGGMFIGLLLGLLIVAAGLLLALNPLAGTVTLTMVFVIWLIADGLIGLVLSLVRRGSNWGLWLLSSLLSLGLGLLLLSSMPLSAAWLLGTYAGIVMLFRGMMLMSMAFDARRNLRS